MDRPPVNDTDLPEGHPLLTGASGLLTMSAANLALGGSWVDLASDAYFELLFAADDKATEKIVATHADMIRPVQPLLADVVSDLDELTTPQMVFGGPKWQKLEEAVTESVGSYSPKIQHIISEGQASAVHIANAAMDQSWTAMALDMNDMSQIGRWNRMPDRAYADLVGRLQDGAPLSDLLETMPRKTSAAMRQGLLRGMALGENADLVGRRVAKATDLPAWRAAAISRSSILNSYRETSRRSYLENPALIDGWFWQSAQDARTCMACLMRDGTLYPLSEKQPAHASCRCRLRPRLRNGENILRQTGREWFDKQGDATKLQMLGPAANRAWHEGKIDLADLAGFAIDPQWGTFSTRRPLHEAISFVERGRPFHPRDYPPGWATPLDPLVLKHGAEDAFKRLEEVKAAWSKTKPAPPGFDEFRACLIH